MRIILLLLFLPLQCFGGFPIIVEILPSCIDQELENLWNSISDIKNPTRSDYLRIEHYLRYGRREYFDIILNHLTAKGATTTQELPEFRRLHVDKRLNLEMKLVDSIHGIPACETRQIGGADINDKSRCVILYGTFNMFKNMWGEELCYSEEVLKLISALEEAGYKGHVIYRLGGFPLVERGGLKLVHIPYSFKVLSFMEAYLLGYEDVLWLDVSMLPTNNLEAIFEQIHTKGSLLIHNGIELDYDYNFYIPLLPDMAVAASGVQLSDLAEIPHIICGIIGISFNNNKGRLLFEEWYRLTSMIYPCITLYPEEFLVSVAAWRTSNRPSGKTYEYFDTRSAIQIRPQLSIKPFWFNKG
jgi:hypothetical protein